MVGLILIIDYIYFLLFPLSLLNFNFINLLHQLIRLRQRHNYLLIMKYIFKLQSSILTVLQPFLGRLVTSDIKLPSHQWHIIKILIIIYPNSTFFIINGLIPDICFSKLSSYFVIATNWIACNVIFNFIGF